jgi:hypothetical protein
MGRFVRPHVLSLMDVDGRLSQSIYAVSFRSNLISVHIGPV